MIRTLKSFDLKNKKILVRVDYNTPMDGELVVDNFRIKSSLPTINSCLEAGASLILMSHLGRPNGIIDNRLSLMPIGEELASLLQMPIKFSNNCVSQDAIDVSLGLKPGEIHLLENLRFDNSEELNDPVFASRLAKHGQIYINDAFGTSHRVHASNVGIIPHFRHFGIGWLMDKELNFLDNFMRKPDKPLALILGGAKINLKIGLIEKFLDKANHILIGGGMSFTFLKAKGKEVGGSLIDFEMIKTAKNIISMARKNGIKIHLPEDVVCGKNTLDDEAIGTYSTNKIPQNLMGLDIGPKTINKFKDILSKSRTVLWNGPLGLFEKNSFEIGTKEIANYLADDLVKSIKTVIGGGDTASAISKFNLIDKMTHVSTGGGSSLKLLSGKPLPALKILEV